MVTGRYIWLQADTYPIHVVTGGARRGLSAGPLAVTGIAPLRAAGGTPPTLEAPLAHRWPTTSNPIPDPDPNPNPIPIPSPNPTPNP